MKKQIENITARQEVEESNYSAAAEPSNRIGDEIWFIRQLKIINEVTGLSHEAKVYFANLSENERYWVQTLLLDRFPYTDALGGLSYPHGTINRYVVSCRRILNFLKTYGDEKQFLKNWSNPDIVEFLQKIALKPDGTLLNSGAVRDVFLVLTDSHLVRHKIDGISMPMPAGFFSKALRGFVESKGYVFNDWIKPGRINLMPCSVAALLLADAIRTIRNERTELVKAYFECIDKSGFFLRASCLPNFEDFTRDRVKGRPNTVNYLYNFSWRLAFVKRLKEIDPSLTSLPFCSHYELSKAAEHVIGACITILLAITGMRLSELHSLRADQVDYRELFNEDKGTWEICDAVVYSKIIKTGGGIIAKRGFSPLGVEVFDLINKLSWMDKKANNLLLFEPTHKAVFKGLKGIRQKTGITLTVLRWRFQDYYQDFISRTHDSIKAAYPHATPHDLRHFKAAFTLRKFDGTLDEVEAAIRQDLRHHSHHTPAYTQNKLNEQERAFVKRDFVREIVGRILTGGVDDRWIGPGVSKLRAAAKKVLDDEPIELLSIEQLAELVETLDNQMHSLTLHSYGACIVIADQVQTAKCGTKHNIVQTGNARSEVCYGCSNFGLSKICHQNEVSLNKRRWQEVSDDPTLSRFKLNENAKNIVKKLEEFEKELGMAE